MKKVCSIFKKHALASLFLGLCYLPVWAQAADFQCIDGAEHTVDAIDNKTYTLRISQIKYQMDYFSLYGHPDPVGKMPMHFRLEMKNDQNEIIWLRHFYFNNRYGMHVYNIKGGLITVWIDWPSSQVAKIDIGVTYPAILPTDGDFAMLHSLSFNCKGKSREYGGFFSRF